MGAESPTWSQFPDVPEPTHPGAALDVVIAVAIVVLPAAVLARSDAGVAWAVLASMVVGVLSVLRLRRGAGYPTVASAGHLDADFSGVVLGCAALSALLARGGSAPLGTLAPQLVGLAFVWTLGGDNSGRIGTGVRAVLRRLRFAVEGLAREIGRAISIAAFLLLGVVVVLIPWGAQRIVRWDPTWSPRDHGSRMISRHGEAPDARRRWSPDPSLRGVGWRRRLHFLTATVAIVAVVLFSGLGLMIGRLIDSPADSPAFASSPWTEDLFAPQFMVGATPDIAGFTGIELADVRSDGTNVVDGRRVTWSPDARSSERLTVWMFGGSAAFGLGQRDEHTIASELARVALREGVVLDVINWGVPGDVQWMERRRLEAALASGKEQPDLVVFYDGVNELDAFNYNRGPDRPPGPFVGTLDLQISRDFARFQDAVQVPLKVVLGDNSQPDDPLPPLTDAGVVEAASRQYRMSVQATLRDLSASGIETEFFYQPSRASRTPVRSDENGDDGPAYRAMVQRFRDELPDGVHDLADVFDGVDAPIFWDSSHTNELGSRIVAQAMFDRLRPTLETLGG